LTGIEQLSPAAQGDELDRLIESADYEAAIAHVRVACDLGVPDAGVQHAHLVASLTERLNWYLDAHDTVTAFDLLVTLRHVAPAEAAQIEPALHTAGRTEVLRATEMQDHDRIAQLGRMFLAAGSTNATLLFNIGCSLHSSRHFDTAIALYRRSRQLGCINAGTNLAMLAGDAIFQDEAMAEIYGDTTAGILPRLLCFRREFDKARATIYQTLAQTVEPTSSAFANAAISILNTGAPQEARRLLDTAPSELQSAPDITYLRNMLDWLGDRLAKLPAAMPPAATREIACVAVCWGAEFVENFSALTLRSLLSPGNLPALSKKHKLTLRIFTDITGRMILKTSPVLRELANYVQIDIETIPSQVLATQNVQMNFGINYYLVFGTLQHIALLEAGRKGQDLIFLISDALYADGSFAHVGEMIARKPLAILYTGFSAVLPEIAQHLEQRFPAPKSIAINPPELTDLVFRHLHTRTRQGFVTRTQQLRTTNLTYLYFPTSWGLIERRINPDPLFIANELLADARDLNFMTNDAELMDRLLTNRADWPMVETIEDNDHFMAVELSENRKNTGEGVVGRIAPNNVASLVGTRVCIGFMRHCFHAEYRFRGSRPPPWHGDEAYYRDFTTELEALLYPEWNPR
jgi:hypothetical protein